MRLRFEDGGPHDGPAPVVLHHGLGADLEVWRGQLAHLRKARRAIEVGFVKPR